MRVKVPKRVKDDKGVAGRNKRKKIACKLPFEQLSVHLWNLKNIISPCKGLLSVRTCIPALLGRMRRRLLTWPHGKTRWPHHGDAVSQSSWCTGIRLKSERSEGLRYYLWLPMRMCFSDWKFLPVLLKVQCASFLTIFSCSNIWFNGFFVRAEAFHCRLWRFLSDMANFWRMICCGPVLISLGKCLFIQG